MSPTIILFLLFSAGFGASYLVAYLDFKYYEEINIPFIFIAIACLLLMIGAIWVYCNEPEIDYKRNQCTEYHVTQKISDKGDTTYVIKYKPL